jgi:copper chaperone NosL
VSWRRALSLGIPFVMLALAACQKDSAKTPDPQEFSKDAVAVFCGMGLAEHPGPKAQIFVRSLPDARWFASVHDAFAYTMLLETPKDIAAIYVNDMGKAKNWEHPEPGTWIEARKAIYVIESRQRGGMDQNEAVPFSSREAAEAFAKEQGGRLVRFEEMPKSYILASADPGPSASNDGLNRDSESAHDRTESDTHITK